MKNINNEQDQTRYIATDGRTFEFERDAMDYAEIKGQRYQDTYAEDYDWRYTGEMGG